MAISFKNFMRFAVITVLFWGVITFATAQSVPAATPKLSTFEVATIKPAGSLSGVFLYPDGRVIVRGASPKRLIMVAFDLSGWQIVGAEEGPRYDVEGKAPEASGSHPYELHHGDFEIRDERLRQMLQSLLIDRFHLAFHRAFVEGKVYLLERAEKEIQLQRAGTIKGLHPTGVIDAKAGTGWTLYGISMADIGRHLSQYIYHAPVIDKTGLDGRFDFESRTIFSSDDFNTPVFLQTFLPVLKEMGLKATVSKGPVETFVIDRAETPSEN